MRCKSLLVGLTLAVLLLTAPSAGIEVKVQAVSSAAGTVLTSTPCADAYIDERNPNTNYGGATYLESYRTSTGTQRRRILLKFAVPKASTATGPATIMRAVIRLYVPEGSTNGQLNGSQNGPGVQKVEEWEENSVTWTNQPTWLGTYADYVTDTTAGTWAEYNVTSLITQGTVANLGLAPDGSNDNAVFASKESFDPEQDVNIYPAYVPQLLIIVDPGIWTVKRAC